MEKIYQIFVSSTYLDLKEERLEILDCILKFGHMPVGMELFNAADESQWDLIKKKIDKSDYYVLIVSDRYGSMDGDVSFTEKEYDYAVSIRKPIISFIRTEIKIRTLSIDFREKIHTKELVKFRKKVQTKNVQFWEERTDLAKAFLTSFRQLMEDKPQNGWIRSDRYSPSKPLDSTSFLYTLDEGENFPSHLRNAKKVYILARTAVNLLREYEKEITKKIKEGCDFRFLIVSPDSEATKYIYGETPHIYDQNAKLMKEILDRIQNSTQKKLNILTINHAPTIGLIYIEKENDAYMIVSLYFLHSRIGRARPHFKLSKTDPWFECFKDEFDILWQNSLERKELLPQTSNDKGTDCPFCKNDIADISFLENNNFFAIYNIAPILRGHSLIIPKKHIISLFELNHAELQEFILLGQQTAKVLSKAFNVDSFNWSIQEREFAGQSISHLHMHVIPRKMNDLPAPGDWYPKLDQDFYSSHIDSEKRPKLSREYLIRIATKLRELSKSI